MCLVQRRIKEPSPKSLTLLKRHLKRRSLLWPSRVLVLVFLVLKEEVRPFREWLFTWLFLILKQIIKYKCLITKKNMIYCLWISAQFAFKTQGSGKQLEAASSRLCRVNFHSVPFTFLKWTVQSELIYYAHKGEQ
jgi:hypothetical protein